MADEKQNQSLKLIRLEDEDRISKLPDCLIVEILSRLPGIKDAVRTGAISKRWEHIWHSVPNLIFLHPYDASPDLFSFVEKILTQRRQSKLKKFKVCCDYRFVSHIHRWIQYAISCNVEELHLRLWNVEQVPKVPLDELFFINSCFTDLTLSGCVLNPTVAISWKNLRTLCISCGKLDEDLIENILSGSHVLETLELNSCNGYRRLNITSKSVKNLVFSGYIYNFGDGHSFEINAPNIVSLKIKDNVSIRKLLLLNVSSLVEADLYYWHGTPRLLTTAEDEEETLKGFILNLRHVKVLKIGGYCFKVLNHLEAKGFIRPSNLKVPPRWFC